MGDTAYLHNADSTYTDSISQEITDWMDKYPGSQQSDIIYLESGISADCSSLFSFSASSQAGTTKRRSGLRSIGLSTNLADCIWQISKKIFIDKPEEL